MECLCPELLEVMKSSRSIPAQSYQSFYMLKWVQVEEFALYYHTDQVAHSQSSKYEASILFDLLLYYETLANKMK